MSSVNCTFENVIIGNDNIAQVFLYGNGSSSSGGITGGGNSGGVYKVYVQKSVIQNTYIYSQKSAAGGIVGDQPYKMTVNITDTTVRNCNIVSAGGTGKGGLAGKISDTLLGSNILWDSNLIKECAEITESEVENWLTGMAFYPTGRNINNSGTWVGSVSDSAADFVQLSGVQKKSTSTAPILENDVGNATAPFNDNATTGSYIVYADYTLNIDNKDGASPYITTNPKSSVVVTNSDSTDTTLTGDGAKTTTLKEAYYLVIKTPADATNEVNMNITSATSFIDSACLPREEKHSTTNDRTGYIYKAINQQLVALPDGTTEKVVSKSDSVTLTLQDTITCDATYANNLPNNAERYLQFAVKLQQVGDASGKFPGSIPPNVTATVTFKLLDAKGKEFQWDGMSGTVYNYTTNADTSELTLIFGKGSEASSAYNLYSLLKNYNAKATDDAKKHFTVEATVNLAFPDSAMTVFPSYTDEEVKANGNTPKGYTQFAAETRISSSTSTLAAGNKKTDTATKGYYRGAEAVAKLDYNAIGDITQLGINVNDLESATDKHLINTQGVYDISALVDKDTIMASATKLVCTVELLQKFTDANGVISYVGVEEGNFISLSGGKYSGSSFTWEIPREEDNTFNGTYNSEQGTFTLLFDVNVITDIEQAAINGTYANYEVKLTVKLMNGTADVTGTSADDYFKYTLARVSTELLTNP